MLVVDGVLKKVDNSDIVNGTFITWEGINIIGENVFENNLLLEYIDIPQTIIEIKKNAFTHCPNLEKVIISDNTKIIGESAFSKCKSLKFIKLPNNLKVIKEKTFSQCLNLNEIIMPEFLEKMEDSSFEYCKSLKNINLSDNLNEIGKAVFYECDDLDEIKLPNSLTKIEEFTFYGCSSLKTINLPKSITSIEKCAFNCCYNLEKIIFPDKIKEIGDYAFYKCYFLENIKLPKDLEIIGDEAFSNCKFLKSIDFNVNLKIIKNDAFSNCKNLGNFVLPNSLTKIESGAFQSCCGITNLVIPENVKEIGTCAFSSCVNIKEITFQGNIDSILDDSFSQCFNLEKIIINGYLKNVSVTTFENCLRLKEIVYDNKILELENCKTIFIKDLTYDKSRNAKLLITLKDNYTINHNVKFPALFIEYLNIDEIKKLLEYENVKHFKNIYINNIKDNEYFYTAEDLTDFYKFAYTLGCFSNEEILIGGKNINVAQKANVFLKQLLDSGEYNIYLSHHLFDSLEIKKYNPDFLKYITLLEKKDGQLIYENFRYLLRKRQAMSRIINEFESIMKTTVIDTKGRVVINPSINKKIETYLMNNVFCNIEDGNEDIVEEFSKFHSISQINFDEAQDIRKKQSNIRHILKESLIEETSTNEIKAICDEIENTLLDSKQTIEELIDKEFTYEWLDKHDPRNFTLGLYCDCCASIVSLAYGKLIMKDSIIRDDVQNLIIKDSKNEIIAKATIYVNKEKGYAVFNDIEMNRIYDEYGEFNKKVNDKIYDAFKRGVNNFVNKYNEIYKEMPLTQVNVGWGYNRLKRVIRELEIQSDVQLDTISSFKDAKNEQWIIYKKDKR